MIFFSKSFALSSFKLIESRASALKDSRDRKQANFNVSMRVPPLRRGSRHGGSQQKKKRQQRLLHFFFSVAVDDDDIAVVANLPCFF